VTEIYDYLSIGLAHMPNTPSFVTKENSTRLTYIKIDGKNREGNLRGRLKRARRKWEI